MASVAAVLEGTLEEDDPEVWKFGLEWALIMQGTSTTPVRGFVYILLDLHTQLEGFVLKKSVDLLPHPPDGAVFDILRFFSVNP